MKAPRGNEYRDAWCGSLSAERVDDTVRVAGWVDGRRDHGGLIFIDLRDRSGIVQLVFHPDSSGEAHALAHSLRSEDVISARGVVTRRDPVNVNPNLATGEIEIAVSEAALLADAETPPFPLDAAAGVDEALRLRHRALDLRRAPMQRALVLRHTVVSAMRAVLNDRDFLEIETPYLTRSTPEGARDYLVPARVAPGSFYALPQSPQLFKQLLMIAGYERYYQIARCFRDEDSRADRQPEFTQLDIEMSFVNEDDVIELMEAVMAAVFEVAGFGGVGAPPYPRMTYAEAMSRFGSDRPDVRFGLELRDLGPVLAASEFKVFSGALASGGVVRGLNAGARELPRSELDALTDFVKQYGARGLVWGFVQDDGTLRSPIAKFLSEAEVAGIIAALEASPGDVVFAVADRAEVAAQALGALRLELARRFSLVPEGSHEVLWVTEFPAFLWNAEAKRWDATHHPFTAPAGDFEDPGSLSSQAYDLVLDGSEIGGGSIRIHDRAVQERVFELLGISAEDAQAR
ncbi:MAG TPA: aspartate--tRNA ligase, partial [Solirubrobacteraceae bacterium]|nr:aspartate--tRNA ligase [Solirubrobacteraceae bacterium]